MKALALVLLMLLALPHWSWPTDETAVVRQYLAPLTPYGPGHRGIDLASTSATVVAPADGVVRFSGVVVDRPVLSIAHAGGLISSFEPVVTALVEGDRVQRGDVIGMTEAGHCFEALCLHFGVRLRGEYVSPLLLLGGVPRSILLPTR